MPLANDLRETLYIFKHVCVILLVAYGLHNGGIRVDRVQLTLCVFSPRLTLRTLITLKNLDMGGTYATYCDR